MPESKGLGPAISVLSFKSANDILKCDHSNERYRAELSCCVVCILQTVVPTFESVDGILNCDHSSGRLMRSTFPWWCFSVLLRIGFQRFGFSAFSNVNLLR